MQIHLIAVGHRMPDWVKQAYEEYARRLPKHCALNLIEITPGRRSKTADINAIIRDEGKRLLAAIPRDCYIIALDITGRQCTTLELAGQIEEWQQGGRNVVLLIGGPDGLAEDCLNIAHQKWSLSKLTFPHPLVRVVLAEQLYRAWSVQTGHPYHRE